MKLFHTPNARTFFTRTNTAKKIAVCIMLLGSVSLDPLRAQNSNSAQVINLKLLDSIFESSRSLWNLPGMAIAMVHNDSVIWAKGYGIKSTETKQPVDANTLFAIASNTKAFTAASLSLLVDSGLISWSDRVQQYLPYFELYDPYVSHNMTIKDLLCHRSGLATFSGDLLWYGTHYTRQQVIERARYLKPTYGFRSRFGYSNIMFIAAGEIIPAVTGQSWDSFVRSRFLDPLGMESTNTSIAQFTPNGNIASPHYVSIDGRAQVIPYVNWDNMGPAGGINSSVNDMAQWLRLWLNKGKLNNTPLLSRKSIWMMHSAHTPQRLAPYEEGLWPSTHFKAYGLGWEMFDYQGAKIVGHDGGADGMISRAVLVPEQNFGFIILTNSTNWLPSALSYTILDQLLNPEKGTTDWPRRFLSFYKDNYNATIEEEVWAIENRKHNAPPSLPISHFAGLYGGPMYGDASVALLDSAQLEIRFLPTPQFVGTLEHWHYNTFRITLKDAPTLPKGWCIFIMDKNGKISEMQIDIPNPDFDFTELKFNRK